MIPDSQPNMIDLSAGSIDYIDTGGDGPTVVLLHGVLMNHTVWSDVITELVPAFRCIAPTLPLGAHREPMRFGADLSIDGIALRPQPPPARPAGRRLGLSVADRAAIIAS